MVRSLAIPLLLVASAANAQTATPAAPATAQPTAAPAAKATAPAAAPMSAAPGSIAPATGKAAAPATASPPASPTAVGTTSPAPATAAPAIALAAKALAVQAGRYRLAPEYGHVTFSVNHRGFSTFTGQFGGGSADLTLDPKDPGKITLTAAIDTGSVSTLDPALDTLLKGEDWFDTKTFPQASFRSTSVTVTGPQTARIDGTLTLRGKTAPIVISATFNNAGIDPVDKQYTVGFDAAAIIRRSTFGLSRDLPIVGDNVTLRLEGEFKPAPPS